MSGEGKIATWKLYVSIYLHFRYLTLLAERQRYNYHTGLHVCADLFFWPNSFSQTLEQSLDTKRNPQIIFRVILSLISDEDVSTDESVVGVEYHPDLSQSLSLEYQQAEFVPRN